MPQPQSNGRPTTILVEYQDGSSKMITPELGEMTLHHLVALLQAGAAQNTPLIYMTDVQDSVHFINLGVVKHITVLPGEEMMVKN